MPSHRLRPAVARHGETTLLRGLEDARHQDVVVMTEVAGIVAQWVSALRRLYALVLVRLPQTAIEHHSPERFFERS